MRNLLAGIALLPFLFTGALYGQRSSAHAQIEQLVDQHRAEYVEASKAIWGYAELGYHEEKSSALLQKDLKEAGFAL